jgi:hypothetical protein
MLLEAVVHRDQRQLDELRIPVDDVLEIAEVDAVVARHDDPHIQAVIPLERLQVENRTIEVQGVGHHVGALSAMPPGRARFSPLRYTASAATMGMGCVQAR